MKKIKEFLINERQQCLSIAVSALAASENFGVEVKEQTENRRFPKREIKTKKILLDEDQMSVNTSPSKRKSKRFHCLKCRKGKSFTTQKQLDRHVQTVHNKKNQCSLICEICSAALRSEVYLKRHMDTRHPENPKTYVCDFDGRTFAAKDYIRIHMDRHRLHQILTCTICQKSYISKHTFRRHLKMHIEKHVCSVCGLVFNQKSLLENHYASKHSEDLPYSCSYCTRLFPSKTARNNHHYIAHKNSKNELKFKCNECNIYFEMKEELRIHSFIHFEGEIKTCLECNQIFKTNRLLKIHMQKHETKKSFQCESCGDCFTFKTGLAKHIRLNRCKGPNDVGKEVERVKQEMNENEIAIIARNQLSEVTKLSKKFISAKAENDVVIDVMMDVKREADESESDVEDNFETFFEPLVKIEKNQVEQVKCELNIDDDAKFTRKVRKRKLVHQHLKQRQSRAHLVYRCDFCGESIKYKKEIINHMKHHKTNHRYNCKECKSTFTSRKKLVDHSFDIHGTKPKVLKELFSCEVCDMKFDVRSIYEAHKLSHDDNARNHICSVCSAAFKSVGNLRRHEAIHVTTRNFHCPHCSKSFKTQLALKVHLEAVHAEFKVFVNCTICKVIIQEKHLRTHMKNQHTEEGQEKPFSCTVCLKTFKTEKLGQRHYEAVHEPKLQGSIYSCPECPDLQFYRMRDLKEHSFIHFDGVIHQCETCLKMFKTKRLMTVHAAIHEDVSGNFACNLCENVSFKTRGGRRKHVMKIHSDRQEVSAVKD